MISSTAYTLTPAPVLDNSLKGDETDLDWNSYLSIELIRQHTKTDDVPAVTDEQLRFYRSVAVEAAELYSGLTLSKQKVVTEHLEVSKPKLGHDYVKVRLKHVTCDGIIYIYGNGQNPEIVHVTPNVRKIKLPGRFFYTPDMSNCCNPCSKATNDLKIMYRSGFSCAEKVPPGVLLGILQFISWVVEHPGDEIMAMRNTLSARGGALIGTNNIALVSGALESWRQFDPEAV